MNIIHHCDACGNYRDYHAIEGSRFVWAGLMGLVVCAVSWWFGAADGALALQALLYGAIAWMGWRA